MVPDGLYLRSDGLGGFMAATVEKILWVETSVVEGTAEGTIRGECITTDQPEPQLFAESFDAIEGSPSEGFDAWCDNNDVDHVILP